MRITAWLVAVVWAVTAAGAQEMIEWSSQRKLYRQDFKGRVPPSASMGSLSWIAIDATWQCDASRELVASARATFDPTQSWWRLAQPSETLSARDVQLLQHEQAHFDLTEIAVRKIRKRLEDDFRNACTRPGGTAEIREYIADVNRELQAEQQQYDRETAHGTNASVQQRWETRIRRELR